MRKFLLASVATLGTGGLAGVAYAQAPMAPTAPPPTLSQGQVATAPSAAPPSFANDNNNYQAPALPGPVANPTPGTIVVHLNGKVQVDFEGHWSSADKRTVTAPAGTPGGAAIAPGTTAGGVVLTPGATAGTVSSPGVNSGVTSTAAAIGNNGAGTVSINPQEISSFARLYAGMDGMATNGLRYGAAIEIRENFTGQISNAGSSGASGYSSLETLYVRRAFTYVAGENWGIFRAGQADGLIGIFDNGVTTFQFLPTGNLNGGDLEGNTPQNVNVPFFFLGQAGNEYDNTKLVYLSPQIAGFDFGLQYAPNTSNGFGMGGSNNALNASITGAGTGTGLGCTVANSGCPTLTSGPGSLDGARVWCRKENRPLFRGHASVLGRGPWGWNRQSQRQARRRPSRRAVPRRRRSPRPATCRISPKRPTTSTRSRKRSTTPLRSAAACGSPISSCCSISRSPPAR